MHMYYSMHTYIYMTIAMPQSALMCMHLFDSFSLPPTGLEFKTYIRRQNYLQNTNTTRIYVSYGTDFHKITKLVQNNATTEIDILYNLTLLWFLSVQKNMYVLFVPKIFSSGCAATVPEVNPVGVLF